MSVIDNIRLDHEDLAKVLKKHLGIRKTVEELYPDSAHFIYELLQNAEDTGAKKVNFYLTKDALVFAHDGRPFNERDIKGITDIGDGSKSEDNDSIGQFGIGFKAVFAYCETPRIWSPTYSFEIRELVLPYKIDPKKECGNKTCFEFLFNNPKKNKSDSYNEVKEGLEKLPAMTLLFLSSIETISWQIDDSKGNSIQRIEHDESHIELNKILNNTLVSGKHFLKFSKALNEHKKQYVSIAFNLEYLSKIEKYDPNKELGKQMKIVPASPGRVSVYFPAEKEISGLRFHLHAPFVPELSRASIKDTPVNNPLYTEIASLAVESLWKIHNMKFLTGDFLAVLPNNMDELSEKYLIVREMIIEEMNNQKLTPTFNNTYLEGKYLMQAKASLKKLLSHDDLNFLLKEKSNIFQWAIGATQKNSLQDRFLSSLMIEKFEIDEFVNQLKEVLTPARGRYSREEPSDEEKLLHEKSLNWFKNKEIGWYQGLYALLDDTDTYDLKNTSIIKLITGDLGVGSKCFFTNNEVNGNSDAFNVVDSQVYSFGEIKKEQEKSKSFLEKIGVKEIDDIEKIKAILEKKYNYSSHPLFSPNINDIRHFISFLEKNPNENKLFNRYYIFQDSNLKWKKPSDIYLDSPFDDTGLDIYFDRLKSTKKLREKKYQELEQDIFYKGRWGAANTFHEAEKKIENKLKLNHQYLDTNIDKKKLVKFALAVGVQNNMEVSIVPVVANLNLEYLKKVNGSEFTNTGIDRDYTIVGLEDILNTQKLDLSSLVWKKMNSIKKSWNKNYLEAAFRMNQSNNTHYSESLLIQTLIKIAWVPQTNGSFVRPAEASVGLLPDGFSYDSGKEWLNLVHFGKETEQKKEKEKEKEEFAKELGFESKEELEDAQAFMKLSKDERKAILDANKRNNDFELPENNPRNPDLRGKRVGKQAGDAPDDTKSPKQRSVSDNDAEIKKEADAYLRQQYTNIDGDMICQICSKELPFKKANGEFYFEKVKFLPKLQKLYYQNYLALCPNHAAMYKVINNSKDELLGTFKTLNENETELEVILGDEDMEIYFTKIHILDMKAVINTDEKEDTE